jgi:hypothetical protein
MLALRVPEWNLGNGCFEEEPNITKGQALEFLSIASRVEEALKAARGSLASDKSTAS